MSLIKSGPEEIIPLLRRTREYAIKLKFWMEDVQKSFVYYVERRARHLSSGDTDRRIFAAFRAAL
ncbi:MAG: hypothetical protein WKF37_06425 [Bryobacteraceae bacterium]